MSSSESFALPQHQLLNGMPNSGCNKTGPIASSRDFPPSWRVSNENMKLYLTVHNVDALVAKLDEVPPEDNPELGIRDCEVKDPDGYRLRIGSNIGKGRLAKTARRFVLYAFEETSKTSLLSYLPTRFNTISYY